MKTFLKMTEKVSIVDVGQTVIICICQLISDMCHDLMNVKNMSV